MTAFSTLSAAVVTAPATAVPAAFKESRNDLGAAGAGPGTPTGAVPAKDGKTAVSYAQEGAEQILSALRAKVDVMTTP